MAQRSRTPLKNAFDAVFAQVKGPFPTKINDVAGGVGSSHPDRSPPGAADGRHGGCGDPHRPCHGAIGGAGEPARASDDRAAPRTRQ
ncbi:hypothetical protein B1813_05865 [Saccharomonospora piscinae]|uniref:Uncharacterized protein n=1 Tax=Saccharomonospora piscinae TaxID=687388 RepID=A0A1V9AAD1_SACPI|nr:hypothetical protein B1813_05865 [Saccharomonospora piscinae]